MGLFSKKNSPEESQKRIAKTSQSPSERMEAIRGITDQQFLFDIAKNDNDFGVCKTAVEQLTNQEFLTAVGRDNAAHDWRARTAAISRMNDRAALQHIVDNEEEITVNYAAQERLKELDSQE
ncbi:hypothetical protein LJB77_01610 [Ruminococcaceae bacterium OttesenSCG-928-N02]|nr:hypothetical protein [Ruminococcaceae bacterium OttesenSCG-928-N02]